MGYLKIKKAGIYKIEHKSGYYYIGMSKDIFNRWQSHYTNFRLKKHSSTEFMELWNKTDASEWSFTIVKTLSQTDYKRESKLRGKAFDTYFRRLLLDTEKEIMSSYSVNYSLNKNKKHFK
jgi:predicted GIY-YIG superfamily endonuclease